MQYFETIKQQPNFPNEDLDSGNIPVVEHFIQTNHEHRSHAQYLERWLRPLHLTAHQALQLTGVEVQYTPAEYQAFCNGFAAFEYASLLVNPRYVREQLLAKNTLHLITGPNVIAEFDMADRREPWVDMYSNINGVITDIGAQKGETLPQLYSRSAGAQIACELQMAA